MDDAVATAAGLLAIRDVPRVAASSWVQAAPPATRYILRGGPDVMRAAGTALGRVISQTPCRVATAADSNFPQATALWLGPDEQLLIAPERSDIGAILERALRDLPHSLVEVSHRQTGLAVCGPQAALSLNAGCPLDLDLSAFPIGMCTRTVLGKAEIVLWRTRQDVFHVEVWRSFADYVSSFLAEVARELAPGRFL